MLYIFMGMYGILWDGAFGTRAHTLTYFLIPSHKKTTKTLPLIFLTGEWLLLLLCIH